MKTSWTPLLDMQLHPPLMDPAFMQQNHLTRAEKEEHAQDNPALSTVIERNIRTIINFREKAAHERSFQARIADVVTAFSGRMAFVYVHIIWFGSWILLNTGRLGMRPFDVSLWPLDDGRVSGSHFSCHPCAH